MRGFAAIIGASLLVTGAVVARSAPRLARARQSAALAPASAQPAGSGLLMGVAVDSRDGRPVPAARVTLGALASANADVLADDEGRFVFADLPAGRYTITAAEPGYAEGAYGRRRPGGPSETLTLGDGERVGDLRIPLWKAGAITGTVTDESGEPLVNVGVRALVRSIVAGHRRLVAGPIVRTDDRGVYRIGALTPGDYLIVVPSIAASAPGSVVTACRNAPARSPFPTCDAAIDLQFAGAAVLNGILSIGAMDIGGDSFRSTSDIAPVLASDGRLAVYPTAYYPAATTVTEASPLTLGVGDERSGIDVHLKLVPALRVSGTVMGPDGPVAVGLTLTPEHDELSSEPSLTTAETVSDVAGQFTFLGVPEGRFILRAAKLPPGPTRGGPQVPSSAPTLSASQSVAVAANDTRGVIVTLHGGFRVTGRIAGENAALSADVLRRASVTFESADGQPLPAATLGRGFIDPDGQLSTVALPAGRYLLRATPPPGWTLKNAMADGRDISTVPFAIERDVNDVVVTFTERPSELNGHVETTTGKPDDSADVLIFPADPAAWTDVGSNPRRLRAIRADADGAYRAIGLPPGDYLVAAITDESAADWQDPTMLQILARVSTAIRLADGETRSLLLRTIVVPR